MSIAVCLVSGGLDSCVAAAEARDRGLELSFFHASYGQRTEGRELQACHAIADYYRVEERMVADLRLLAKIGGSALTDRRLEVPEGPRDGPGTPISYVPFRNAILLSAATGWAESLGAEYVYIGAVEEDGAGYPDCRQVFFDAFQIVMDTGTRDETLIRLEVPLIGLTKAEIVRRGLELGAPLEHTWSCYQDSKLACGRCESCLLRLRGFSEAGQTDPILYQPLPATSP